MIGFDEKNHIFDYGGVIIPSVSQLMQSTGIIKPTDFDMTFYAERGTLIHKMTELIDQGIFCPTFAPDYILEFLNQYELFRFEHDVEVILSEEIVFNPRLLYAGIIDRKWRIDGEMQITDIKSTSKENKEHSVQTTAYRLCTDVEKTSVLYLHEDSYNLAKTTDETKIVEAMSMIYWYNRPRDYKRLRKMLEVA